MFRKLGLLTGTALLALAGMASSLAYAADYIESGCQLSGSVTAGILYEWQNLDDIDVDIDWTTPFGEGAGLVTCRGLNIQADAAHFAHSGSVDVDEERDLDQSNSHIGGALFYRDPASWAGGLQASWISQDLFGTRVGAFRVGLFGELYLNEIVTLGTAAAYYDSDKVSDSFDDDGFELTAYGRFYATPDLSMTLRGDVLLAKTDDDNEGGDRTGYAITGEAEYLVWDQGLSLFAGARYAQIDDDYDDSSDELDSEHTLIFGGIKLYFGEDGTLAERQRSAPVDNSSMFKERLPQLLITNGEE